MYSAWAAVSPTARILSILLSIWLLLLQDRESGRPRGFAFVTMTSGADQAVQGLNETEFQVGTSPAAATVLTALVMVPQRVTARLPSPPAAED